MSLMVWERFCTYIKRLPMEMGSTSVQPLKVWALLVHLEGVTVLPPETTHSLESVSMKRSLAGHTCLISACWREMKDKQMALSSVTVPETFSTEKLL